MFVPPRGADGDDIIKRFPLEAAVCRAIQHVTKVGQKPSAYCVADGTAALELRRKEKEQADRRRDELLESGIEDIPTLSKQGRSKVI